MIISHRYRFVFLKTEKTASTSLDRLFRDLVEAEDRIYPADRSVRRRLLKERGSLSTTSFYGQAGGLRRALPQISGLHRHATAGDVRAFLGGELFSQYRIISSERNPFDRQLSLYTHRAGRRGESAAEFSRRICSRTYGMLHYNRLDNWGIYTIGGRVVADHIIRFENLEGDLRGVLQALGVDPARFVLPHMKSSGARVSSYRDFYDAAARERVASWYRNEIEHFGYEF